MKRNYFIVVFFIMSSFLFGCQKKGDTVLSKEEAPIRIGYMICNSRSESEERFKPITAYLSEKIGRKFEPILVDTFDFEELVRDLIAVIWRLCYLSCVFVFFVTGLNF